jgi:hypothetical protein
VATAALLAALFLALVTIVVVRLVGMRTKSPPVLKAIRKFNRAVSNPRQMESAGTLGAYVSVIRHSGPTSGRRYETPVGAVATDDGFVITLPYGSHAGLTQERAREWWVRSLEQGEGRRQPFDVGAVVVAVERHSDPPAA